MITEDYVSFETAKLLKEKGFDESTSMVYMSYGDLCKLHRYDSIRNSDYNDITKNYFEYTASTLYMAMKWLREVHNICITIYPEENGYEAVLYDIENDVEIVLQSFGVYGIHIYEEIYEDAVEAALKYCLKTLI